MDASLKNRTVKGEGSRIVGISGILSVPDKPNIPYIEGDGIGPEVVRAAIRVLDAAVEGAYGTRRRLNWVEAYAGEKARREYGEALPEETLKTIQEHVVALKGPLETPIAEGYRSLNVALRQRLDLYACVRPVKYIPSAPSRLKHPEELDLVIFRENTEDVYSGIEFEEGSEEARRLIDFLRKELRSEVRPDSAIGIKPISEYATKRIVRAAIDYAIRNNRRSVTIVHKGNIMKYTEGGFMKWAYEVANTEFKDKIVTESELKPEGPYRGVAPPGKIIIRDRLADNMFQQLILRTGEYDVLVLPNLNGDYISDLAAAMAGGLGLAPGANINFETGVAVFEPTHGTAPAYANQDKVNPTSTILSGVLMLRHIGWKEAADKVEKAVARTISQRRVTYDLARQLEGVQPIGTSKFADAIIENMQVI
ncbi:isocitrate dehydrogenase (NADP(+)) [Candidatus Bathyarchaeota archaeon]|nr:isocitrate dehydrogenase (NADP(+)) [Candidatus Bathyarchaeota archaeon]